MYYLSISADKKAKTPKRRRSLLEGESSPTSTTTTPVTPNNVTQSGQNSGLTPKTPGSGSRRPTVPMSERQQMLMVMRQFNDGSAGGRKKTQFIP